MNTPLETISPIDWGPIYKETLYGRWPVEPWNTATTLFFLVFVIYWSLKIKNNWREHLLLTMCLPVVFVGFIGGFLYHSFRDNKVWLLLDWGPIMLTALICCTYYWRTLVPSWKLSLFLTFVPLAFVLIVLKTILPQYLFMSLGYPLLACLVLTPLFLSLRKRRSNDLRYLLYAVVCVSLAITLRFLDKTSAMNFLPMGSHFLWHTLGALTCHYFAAFNFRYGVPMNFRGGGGRQSP
jgi:hemolysin III